MASEKMFNRLKKVVLGASNGTLEVRRVKKVQTDFLTKYNFTHKTLTKYNLFFLIFIHSERTGLRSGLQYVQNKNNARHIKKEIAR